MKSSIPTVRAQRSPKQVAKAKLLKAILAAGDDLVVKGYSFYTCHLLNRHGVSQETQTDYFDVLFYHDMESPNWCEVRARLSEMGYPIALDNEYETRLLMLAWFHEMVRTGEFDRIVAAHSDRLDIVW